jgi:ribosome-associated protein
MNLIQYSHQGIRYGSFPGNGVDQKEQIKINMKESKETLTAEGLAQVVVKGMQEKKGQAIIVMDLRSIKNSIADFFVLCTGTSDTHVDAIADSVEKEVYIIANQDPWHREGKQNKEWILLDYVDVVVHVFKKEIREFYSLEDLWGDAVLTSIEDLY